MNTNRIRYKQRDFHLNEIDNYNNIEWSLEQYGCGPTSISNILVNLGFDINPIYAAKKILFDKKGAFDKTYLRNKGINEKGLTYCLERLIKEDNIEICYEIVKINFDNPNNQKDKVIEILKERIYGNNSCWTI